MSDQLLTAREVAEFFQVSEASVRRWVMDGELEAVRTPGGRGMLRFRREDVERLFRPPAAMA